MPDWYRHSVHISPFSLSTLSPQGWCSVPCGLSLCKERTHMSDPSCRTIPEAFRALDTSCLPCLQQAQSACALWTCWNGTWGAHRSRTSDTPGKTWRLTACPPPGIHHRVPPPRKHLARKEMKARSKERQGSEVRVGLMCELVMVQELWLGAIAKERFSLLKVGEGSPLVAVFLQMFLSLFFPPLASASTHLPPVASDLSPKATLHPPFYCFPLSTSFLSLPLPFLHFWLWSPWTALRSPLRQYWR